MDKEKKYEGGKSIIPTDSTQGQVLSLTSLEVSRQVLTNDLKQVLSVSLLMTSLRICIDWLKGHIATVTLDIPEHCLKAVCF